MNVSRTAIALVVALLLVFAAALGSAVLLVEADDAQLSGNEMTAFVAAAFERHVRDQKLLLDAACQRDLHVERLALELAAGGTGEVEAEQTAAGLARTLGGDFWLFAANNDGVRALGSSHKTALAFDAAMLQRAAKDALAVRGHDEWYVIEGCHRAAGAAELWMLRGHTARQLEQLFSFGAAHTVFALPYGQRSPHGRAGLAVSLPGVGGPSALSFWVLGELSTAVPWGMVPLLALCVLFAALLAYQVGRTNRVDDSVLVELERAAQRVAKGDLSSRIERRAGGRADQTFQTFDRMTAELRDMRTRLAEAERANAWQDMARRIAHEIKNPLAPIQMAIETLRKAHARRLGSFDEIFEESTRAILDEVRRLEHIVREFSEFARLPKPKPGLLDLTSLVEETVALYRPQDVVVDVIETTPSIAVRVDREQIVQVVVNLVQNACDAARASTEPRVAVRCELNSAGRALVHVDDSGPGVAQTDRERIFEPYFTTKEHGSGLGLAIARRIVLDHAGSIEVTNSPLGGARFTVYLPLAP